MIIDELLLLSGNDIPFVQAQLVIHQPKIKQIAYMTEPNFWSSCELLKFDKNYLQSKDKNELSDMSNFNIIMMMIREKSNQAQKARVNMTLLFTLLFPMCSVTFQPDKIILYNNQTKQINQINEQNFDVFKDTLVNMFCLTGESNKQYNPSGRLAEEIVQKIMKGRNKKAQAEANKKIAILSRYISILAVGENKSINDLMDYTIYQLMDEFTRFQLKLHYDSWERYRIAGAKGMKDPQDWLKDIYEVKNDTKDDINF